MKRIFALLLAALMLLGLAACGTTESTGSAADTKDDGKAAADPAHQENEGDLGDYHAVITGMEVGKDYEGKDALLVHYTFTNNSEETTSAGVALILKAFQNGVQLETAIVTDVEGVDNTLKEIRPGASIDVTEAFELTDTTTVELELTELISFSDEMITASYDFEA